MNAGKTMKLGHGRDCFTWDLFGTEEKALQKEGVLGLGTLRGGETSYAEIHANSILGGGKNNHKLS